MDELRFADKAIEACLNGKVCFSKFLSANDTGATGAHQSGYYIPLSAYSLLFNEPGQRGENKDKLVKIRWQDDFETDSRAIYYGRGTRNEYRITRFGNGFPFQDEEKTGSLMVLIKNDEYDYSGYVLESDAEIEHFLEYFGLTPSDTNQLIEHDFAPQASELEALFREFILGIEDDFPTTEEMARQARMIRAQMKGIAGAEDTSVIVNPDAELQAWLEVEYDLFKAFEVDRYSDHVNRPLDTVDHLVAVANTILNRRKSRAGKSLEHHLAEIFTLNKLEFTYQPETETSKRPDFLFPGQEYYFNEAYKNKLVFLGAKTTCKDRWRQILREADRIDNKHLFTLQQGISASQLDTMYDAGVTLVVPKNYLSAFPKQYQKKILTLKGFIGFVRAKNT